MICKYFLTLGKTRKEIPHKDFKNWEEVEYSIERSDYTGAVRSFSSDFEFVGDTADRITDAVMEYGLYGTGEIEVQVIQNDHTFRKEFACPLYFASYKRENDIVKINTLDNSLAAIIKANKSKKYEYKMSEFTDSKDRKFKYEGVELDNMVSFKLGGDANSDHVVRFDTIPGEEFQKLPLTQVDEEIVENQNIVWHSEQTPEAFVVKSNEELVKIADVLPNDHGFPYGAYTDGLNYLLTNSKMSGGEHPTIEMKMNAEFKLALPDGVTTEDFEIWATTTVIHGAVINLANSTEYVTFRQFKADKSSCVYRIENFGMRLFPNYSVMLMARVRNRTSISVRVLSSNLKLTWGGASIPTYMDYITPDTLLQKLMNSMVDGRRQFTCNIDVPAEEVSPQAYEMLGSWDTDSRLKHTIIIPKDVITNNPPEQTYVRTTFNNFCKWMETVFGYVYVIDGDNITFCHRTKIFADELSQKEMRDISEVKYEISRDAVFSTVEVGYDHTDDDAFNMKYEFNRKSTYDTGIINTERKMSLISPYRADSIGFELAYKSGLEAASDDKSSQEGLWFIYTEDIHVPGLDLKVVAQGVGVNKNHLIKKGMFNYVFSPIYILKANSRFLSSFVRQLKLTSSTSNNIIYFIHGDMYVKRDFFADKDDCDFFTHPQFTSGELSFVTDDQEVPENMAIPISVVWKGSLITGYVLSIDARYEWETSNEYKLIVKKIEKL